MVIQTLRHSIESAPKQLIRFAFMVNCLALLISQPVRAQSQSVLINQLVPVDSESGDIVYTDRVAVAGVPAVVLYNRAHRFLIHTLQPGSLLPMTHPARNHLSQCGIVSLTETKSGHSVAQDYRVTVEISVKEGRYRYRLSQFRAHPHAKESELAIRDLYPCDKQTYSYSMVQAQPLRAWHRSVQTYITQLQQYMTGFESGLIPR